jgi:AraC-like DNA-binding protein
VCLAGPHDRPFEEQHANDSISLVFEGSFQYRSPLGRYLMIPGSILLGNAGCSFECSHQHGIGDRCVSFSFSPEYLHSRLSGMRDSARCFDKARLSPLPALSPAFSQLGSALLVPDRADWEDLAQQVALRTLDSLRAESKKSGDTTLAAEARVTRAVRMIEASPKTAFSVEELAREAKLSPYHFLRLFLQVTGLTPHQYVRRLQLRRAASELLMSRLAIIELATSTGFDDISTFNRAFRAEFGCTPRTYRTGHIPSRNGDRG